ncbi:MAG: TetR/AcrR family transcriptional regulator [Candidatus Hydrogenedentota bacterium]
MTTAKIVKKDTKTAIMDAAEFVMAEHGVDGATISQIVSKAGANIAAIHYHFNSRDGLITAMLGRHGRFTSERRLELIREFDESGVTPKPMDVVSFLVDPMIELLEEQGEAGRRYLRFLARLQSDRKGRLSGTAIQVQHERKYYPEIRLRMLDLTGRACPDISETELRERLTMIIDTMLQSFANAEFMSTEWEEDEQYDELQRYTMNLKNFLTGGLAAPAAK